ncbi:MAG: ATP synthase F1 subunit delta [Mariprofundaceae bacterium]|nr:ATP synthase F1 subunit delta [Mariprofundaceae bacterium]
MSGERAIASRYATALFELHQEGIDLAADLNKVAQVAAHEDASAMLVNAQIAAADRANIVMKAAGVTSEHVSRLLVLLCGRKKAALLPYIDEMLEQQIRESKAKIMVDVTVAKALDKKLAGKLKDSISKGLGKEVDLNIASDASILGGLILNIGDRQIDHSVLGRMNSLKRSLAV